MSAADDDDEDYAQLSHVALLQVYDENATQFRLALYTLGLYAADAARDGAAASWPVQLYTRARALVHTQILDPGVPGDITRHLAALERVYGGELEALHDAAADAAAEAAGPRAAWLAAEVELMFRLLVQRIALVRVSLQRGTRVPLVDLGADGAPGS